MGVVKIQISFYKVKSNPSRLVYRLMNCLFWLAEVNEIQMCLREKPSDILQGKTSESVCVRKNELDHHLLVQQVAPGQTFTGPELKCAVRNHLIQTTGGSRA